MNLVAKIKRLEMEAAERDKRIAALEARVHHEEHAAAVKELNEQFDITVLDLKPKKRKPRAKTSTTE